jgi:4-diphosphocytidyl-2-C-methyl-D-erythritol kinase
VKIRAPAKVNLSLRVLGKRRDGYHLLDTIMVPISLYDEIHIRAVRGTKLQEPDKLIWISCDQPAIPLDEKNIAYRAAQLLMERAGSKQPIHIDIRKRIPVGAGLGGGSTDAAATLIGLNRLLNLRLSRGRLEKLGLLLGTDVPFFIRGGPARARGIGERLRPIRNLPGFWLLVIYPGFPVETAWVYRNLATLTKPMANTSITTHLRNRDKLANLLVNDLERVTIGRYPHIGVLRERLMEEGAAGASMSGSGSAVFGVFYSRQRAKQAFNRLRKEEGVQIFLARGLT